MANNDKKRKSTRHFNLEKPIERKFDLEKEETAPIEQPKVEVPKAPVTPSSNEGQKPTGKKEGGKSNKQDPKQPKQPEKLKQPTKIETVKPVVPVVEDTHDTSEGDGSSHKWMWIIGAILIIAIIAWLALRGCSSSNGETQSEPVVETVDATETSEEEVTEEPASEVETEPAVSSDAKDGSVLSESESGVRTETPASSATTSETTSPAPAAATSTPAANETSARPAVSASSAVTSAPSAEVSSDIEAEALKVIRGVYGTGIERKLKLGSKYREIQNRVNELKRQGAF